MAYRCECGNAETFFEVFDEAVDIVDGTANQVQTKARNVAFCVCPKCDRQIDYRDFAERASSSAN
jgi:hypothetical protein